MYASIADMVSTNPVSDEGLPVQIGEFALVSNPGAQLYVWEGNSVGWTYLEDLSGSQGVAGPRGDKGDPGESIKGDTGATGKT